MSQAHPWPNEFAKRGGIYQKIFFKWSFQIYPKSKNLSERFVSGQTWDKGCRPPACVWCKLWWWWKSDVEVEDDIPGSEDRWGWWWWWWWGLPVIPVSPPWPRLLGREDAAAAFSPTPPRPSTETLNPADDDVSHLKSPDSDLYSELWNIQQ